MPSYQQAAYLGEAVRSVLDGQGADVELLVMDPGSTDGSRELLQRLKVAYGERLRLFFEPDAGQSDAINRGFARARGSVLGWLNSDDRLRPGVLSGVAGRLAGNRPAWLYGRAGIIDDKGRPTGRFICWYKGWRGRRFSRCKLLTENFIPQMATFWNRAMWERAGGLDTSLHLDMDYDLWLRFAAETEPAVVSQVLADFRVHGAAKGSRQMVQQLDAALHTARRHADMLGVRGSMAVALHRMLAWRTRLVYRWLKP